MKIRLNLITVSPEQGSVQKKIIADEKGQPIKDPNHELGIWGGISEDIELDNLQDFSDLLKSISRNGNQALVMGVHGLGKRAIATKKSLEAYPQQKDTHISRSLDYFGWSEPFLIPHDHDQEPNQPHLTLEEFLNEYFDSVPEAKPAGRVSTVSTSSSIYCKETKECLKPASGHHTYFLAMGDVERYKRILTERFWLHKKAFYKLANPNEQTGVPAVLERFLVDMSVFSPERLVYEAGACFEANSLFEQHRPEPQVFCGEVFNLDSIPDLTEEEKHRAEIHRKKAFTEIKKLQKEKTLAYISVTQPNMEKEEIEMIAKQRIQQCDKGILSANHILYRPDGTTLKVADISVEHDGLEICDPQEPDYDGGRAVAKIFIKDNGEWIINSFAHGKKTYRREKDKSKSSNSSNVTRPKNSKIAAELREKYSDRLSFNSHSEQWFYYAHSKEGRWDIIPEASLQAIVQSELDVYPGLESGYSMGDVTSVIGLLRGRLARSSWDEHLNLLPFENGVYNLSTNELKPHAPGYGFTWQLPRPYLVIGNPNFPQINAWLNEVTQNSPQTKQILLCWLNAVLKRRSDLQKFLHLVGPGGTGKGTFLRLAIALVGEINAHSSSLDVICQDKFELANLVGKCLLTFSDEDKYSGRLGIFKQVTGGDSLRAEQKHKTAYTFRFNGLAMVASNYPIFAGDTSSGLHRRVLLVPFINQIPSKSRRNLESEFNPELADLTTYLLSLDDSYVTNTLLGASEESPEVRELTWDMRLRTDSIAAWLNDSVVRKFLEPGKYYESVGSDIEDTTALFGNYSQWCKRTGSKAVNLKEFSPRLLDLCRSTIGWNDVIKKKTSSGMVIYGLKLRAKSDTEDNPIDALCLPLEMQSVGSSAESGAGSSASLEPLLHGQHAGCEGLDKLYDSRKDPKGFSSATNYEEAGEERNQIAKKDCALDPSHPSHTSYKKELSLSPNPAFHSSSDSTSLEDAEIQLRVTKFIDELEGCKSWGEVQIAASKYCYDIKKFAWNWLKENSRDQWQRILDLKPSDKAPEISKPITQVEVA